MFISVQTAFLALGSAATSDTVTFPDYSELNAETVMSLIVFSGEVLVVSCSIVNGLMLLALTLHTYLWLLTRCLDC